MTKKDDGIRRLYDALAESVIETTDEEILEDCRESGRSPEKVAGRMRDVLRRSWKVHQQRTLTNRATYLRAASLVQKRKPDLPGTPEERRVFLRTILTQQPEAERAVTAQFRDFEEMTDEDVESWLERFGHLGLLPPRNDSKQ